MTEVSHAEMVAAVRSLIEDTEVSAAGFRRWVMAKDRDNFAALRAALTTLERHGQLQRRADAGQQNLRDCGVAFRMIRDAITELSGAVCPVPERDVGPPDYIKDADEIIAGICKLAGNAERHERAMKVVDAARWAIPLAKIALEDHRQIRLRAGHTFGTKMVGLYDDEVDEMRRHEAALAALDAAGEQP